MTSVTINNNNHLTINGYEISDYDGLIVNPDLDIIIDPVDRSLYSHFYKFLVKDDGGIYKLNSYYLSHIIWSAIMSFSDYITIHYFFNMMYNAIKENKSSSDVREYFKYPYSHQLESIRVYKLSNDFKRYVRNRTFRLICPYSYKDSFDDGLELFYMPSTILPIIILNNVKIRVI